MSGTGPRRFARRWWGFSARAERASYRAHLEPLEERHLLAFASFLDGVLLGTIQSNQVDEASGLVASRSNADILWTHNDSGDSARLFAMNLQGEDLGIFTVSGASNRDWEDIAVGPGPVAGVDYLYISDTGNNAAHTGGPRPDIDIYRVPEPLVDAAGGNQSATISGAEQFTLTYPDEAHDGETIMVDPWTGDIFVITKRDPLNRVYRLPAPGPGDVTATLEFVGEMSWGDTSGGSGSTGAVGGDISPTGREILVKNYQEVFYYDRPLGTTVADVLIGGTPISVPYVVEPKGESVSFDGAGKGYFTHDENTSGGANHPPIYFYDRDPTITVPAVLQWQDGYYPSAAYSLTRDASLAESEPAVNLGTIETVTVAGGGIGDDLVALLQWQDLSLLPANSPIEAAAIALTVSDATTIAGYELFEALAGWNEVETTWDESAAGTPWQTAGAAGAADRGTTVLGTVAPASPGRVMIALNPDGIDVVRDWINNPATNRGFVLANPANGDTLQFGSREAPVALDRPKLMVSFFPPDFDPPTVSIEVPLDNGPVDQNPNINEVLVSTASAFEFQLTDQAVNDASVTSAAVVVRKNGALQTAGVDYQFSYITPSDRIVLTPPAPATRFSLASYEITLSPAGAKIVDTAGNELPETVLEIVVDSRFPTPLAASLPLGSLIYDNAVSGNLLNPGDAQSYTIDVDAGQTITLVVTPDAGLRSTLELFAPGGASLTGGPLTAAAAGEPITLQVEPAVSAGTYTVVIGQAGATVGGFNVQLVLGAMVEEESHGGAPNDTPAAAADLSTSSLDLGGGVDRLAVLGTTDDGVADDYYSFSLDAGQTVTLVLTGQTAASLELELLDAGGQLALAADIGTNVGRVIRGFPAPASGDYFVRVAGDAVVEYTLAVVRGADFEVEPNDAPASAAQDISTAGKVLGAIAPGDAVGDYYTVSVSAGDVLTISTSTPGDGPFQPPRTLNPRVELFSPSGTILAAANSGATDGRNAVLVYPGGGNPPLVTGSYTVRVRTESTNDGPYMLTVDGHTGAPPAFRVVSTDPADGAQLQTAPNELTVTFNDLLLFSSLDAADLTIDGEPATGVRTISGDTVAFEFPHALAGTFDVTVAAGGLTDLQGTPIEAFSGQFTIYPDPVIPAGGLIYDGAKISAAVAGGATQRFLLKIDPRQSIAVVVQPQPSLRPAVELLDTTGASAGSLIAASAGESVVLQPNDPALWNTGPGGVFTVLVSGADGTAGGFGLEVLLGAVVSEEDRGGADDDDLLSAQDLDGRLVSLTPGGIERRAAVVGTTDAPADFSASLSEVDTLFGPNVVTFDFATSVVPAGPGTLVLSVSADLNNNQEWITVTAEGIDFGDFFVSGATDYPQVPDMVVIDLTEAQLAALAADGTISVSLAPTNDVQNSGTEMVQVDLAYPGRNTGADYYHLSLNQGESISVALAGLYDRTVLADAPAAYWRLADESNSAGAVAVDAAGNHPATYAGDVTQAAGLPHVDGAAVRLDGAADYLAVGDPPGLRITGEITLEAWIQVDATDGLRNILAKGPATGPAGEIVLRIFNGFYEVGSSTGPLVSAVAPIPAEDVATGKWTHLVGVYNGARWELYRDGQRLAASSATRQGAVDVDAPWAIGADGGGSGRFFEGVIDEVAVYDRALSPGRILAHALVPDGRFSDSSLAIVDAAGQPLAASDTSAQNIHEVIQDFVAPATGDYYLRASGSRAADYSLVVTRETSFDREPNNSLATGQDITLSGSALGALSAGDAAGDLYRVSVGPNATLTITTATPGDGPLIPVNVLDPRIEVLSPSGLLIASDDNGAADGRNVQLVLPTTTPGLYTIRVLAAGGTAGEYLLGVSGHDPAAVPVFEVLQATFLRADFQVSVDFNDSLYLPSLEAADLVIDGVLTATAVTLLDHDTAIFELPLIAEGLHTLSLAGGAILDLQQTPIGPFTTDLTVEIEPQYIVNHPPYLQLGNAPLAPLAGSGTDQVVILWQTVPAGVGEDDKFFVEYRPAGGDPWTAVPAISQLDTGVGGRINHSATITGLAYDSAFEYRVTHRRLGFDVNVYQGMFQTRLAAGNSSPFTFVAYGDSASLPLDPLSENFLDVQQRVNVIDPALVFSLGDNAYSSGTHQEFDARFDPNLNPLTPAFNAGHVEYAVMGNHDERTAGGQPLRDNYALPVPAAGVTSPVAPPAGEAAESFYSFDYGDVHFAAFDSNSWTDPARLTEQLTWLVADVQSSSATWKIVSVHHPVASLGTKHPEHTPATDYYQQVVAALNGAGVDLLLAGHDHTYQRSFPLLGESGGQALFARDTDGAYPQGVGVVQVIAGTGGHGLGGGVTQTDSYVAAGFSTGTATPLDYGVVRIDVSADTLTVRYVTVDGAVLDTFTIGPDTDAPRADLLSPADNGPADADPADGALTVLPQSEILIQLSDWGEGILDVVSPASVQITHDAAPLAAGVDYDFSYDSLTDVITLTPPAGVPRFALGDYELTVSPAGEIEDMAGNVMPPAMFNVSMQYVLPMPRALEPLGGLVYDLQIEDEFFAADATRGYTVDLDDGQTLSVVVSPEAALQATLQIIGPSGPATAVLSAVTPGQPLLLQNLPLAEVGQYTLAVGATAGTLGAFTLRAVLGAAIEEESHGGAANDDPAGAVDLDATFTDLVAGGAAQRAAVVGNLASVVPTSYLEGFEAGDVSALGPEWTLASTNQGRIRVLSNFNGAGGTSFSLVMDDAASSTANYALNEATLTIDLAGAVNPVLSFYYRESNDETHLLPTPSFTGSADGDGVSISADGVTWYPILNAPNTGNNWNSFASFDLAAQAAAAGIPLTSNFQVRFQQYDNVPLNNDGRAWDEISVTSDGGLDADLYNLTLPQGQAATVAVSGRHGNLQGVDLSIRDAAGDTLATTSTGSANAGRLISDFIAPAAGTYFVEVAGGLAAEYTLVVTRGAALDTEPNDAVSPAAQDISRTGVVLGSLVPGSSAEDFYSVFVADGDTLTISTSTPGDGPLAPENLLDPTVFLYDPAGVQLDRNRNGAPDGRNSLMVYPGGGDPLLAAGIYTIRVVGDLGTSGDYVLGVSGHTGGIPPRPFERIEPLGGLMSVSRGSQGLIPTAAGADAFRVFLTAGESLAAVATPHDPAATLSVEVVGAAGGPAQSPAPGQPAILQPVVAPADGFYDVRISGLAAATTFTLDLYRNSSVEVDAAGGGGLGLEDPQLALASGRFGVTGHSDPGNAPTTLVTTGATWRYLDDGSDQQTAWIEPDFDDSLWTPGPSVLGYGVLSDGGNSVTIATTVGFGPNANDKFVTTYFRHEFFVDRPEAYDSLTLGFLRDDGGAVYLNGTRVMLSNLADGADYLEFAGNQGGSEIAYNPQAVDPALLVRGRNVLAVEVHQRSGNSSDIGMDVILTGTLGPNGAADFDEYTVDLSGKAGETIDVVLAGEEGADFSGTRLELLDPDGVNVLATGSDAPLGQSVTNFAVGILGFTVPAGGVYNLRVIATAAGRYGLVVTESTLFDTEPNDNALFPLRQLAGTRGALGHLTEGDVDAYQLDVSAGELIVLATATPLDNPQAGLQNRLDPLLVLRDSSGQTIDGDDNTADGKNSLIVHRAAADGVLTVEVSASSGRGEYLLRRLTGGVDFGDAPASYGTLLADGGALHAIAPEGVYLGTPPDADADGLPSIAADGDDATGGDEDGVVFLAPLVVGQQTDLRVDASAAGRFSGWMDFNADGDFNDPGEQVFTDRLLAAGANLLDFLVPPASAAGTTYARFRFSTAGGLSFAGPAADGEVEDYRVQIVSSLQPQVVGRLVFYNNSVFDGNDPAAGASDDAAIAVDKTALLPSQSATFANYTSFAGGINGVMIDVLGLADAAALSAADFMFRVGNDGDPTQWPAAVPPVGDVAADVRLGAGPGGAARVTLIWPDGAITGQWLQVTVRATPNTGLAADDVFYFGNAVGETGDAAGHALVNFADVVRIRANFIRASLAADIDNPFDVNRDGHVDIADVILAQGNLTAVPGALTLLTAPAPAPADAVFDDLGTATRPTRRIASLRATLTDDTLSSLLRTSRQSRIAVPPLFGP